MPVMRGWSSSAERDVVRGITRMCAAGLDSIALRREVLGQVKRLVPSEACFFNTLDPETGLVTHGMGEGAPKELMRQFFSYVYPGGEAERVVDLARSGEIVDREASDEMRRLFSTMGFDRELRAAFTVRDEPWGLWCAMREHGSRPFDDRERALMRRIARPVGRALRTTALREVARAASEMDEGAPGIVVVDAHGTMLQRTAMASAHLADLADVGRGADELPSVVWGLIARHHARDGAMAPLRAHGQSGRWYGIQAERTEPDASGRSSTIVLITPLGRREVAPLLAKLYGLSPREREVLTLVARGLSTKEIATRLGISGYTVQEHLSHASDKVGVRGRRALLARLFFDGYAARLHG